VSQQVLSVLETHSGSSESSAECVLQVVNANLWQPDFFSDPSFLRGADVAAGLDGEGVSVLGWVDYSGNEPAPISASTGMLRKAVSPETIRG
jgi:hypothetical protein